MKGCCFYLFYHLSFLHGLSSQFLKKNNRLIYILGTLKYQPRYLTYIFLIQLSHNKRKRHILDCTAATNGKSEILGGGRRGQILMSHNR